MYIVVLDIVVAEVCPLPHFDENIRVLCQVAEVIIHLHVGLSDIQS